MNKERFQKNRTLHISRGFCIKTPCINKILKTGFNLAILLMEFHTLTDRVHWQGMHTGCIPLGISNFGFYGKVSTHLTEYSINSAVIALIAFLFSSTNSDWLKIKLVVIQEGKQNILKHFSGNDIVPVRSEMRPSEGSIS